MVASYPFIRIHRTIDVRSAAVRRSALLPTEPNGVEMVAKFFRALSDPVRLRLLEFLLHDEHTVTECVTHVGLSQGRVSTHLGCLADCGYVEVRREGRFAYYRVGDPRVAELVLLARSLAADNATALAACMRITPAP
ncbi:ArsR family transcriptional regulator [Amycolatopsis suaedae]|uniref:ArsR family transcriptional regulator n=2 Tax=Amycolatopsis suaedae TaxID=2510978 RepID=A0A4Q7JAS8_9PSEU|nr:ArsR family transcriptional regulator [Amycolatopsis suaedae]